MKFNKLALYTALSVFLIGCNGDSQDKQENATQQDATVAQEHNPMPANHPPMSQAAPTNGVSALNQGMVTQTFVGGGYTYAEVEQNGQKVWLAGPAIKLKEGSIVKWRDAAAMTNFNSPSLGRSFDTIYFISAYILEDANVMTAGVIEETIPSAGYVYIKVKQNSKVVWLAAPETELVPGEAISWEGGSVMKNFRSNSLDRVFPEIIFIDRVSKNS